MTAPRCTTCKTDMVLITLRDRDGEFARRWKCCRCEAGANAGMVQSDLKTRPTLLGTYSDEIND
jgi:hypothetical protein